jgi:mono/diheme cytochrome c family protein
MRLFTSITPSLRLATLLLGAAVVLGGCRHTESDKPPIHVNPNMDWQERYDPQETSNLFSDGRAMRPPVPGTVARGFLKADNPFFQGRTDGGEYVDVMPVAMTAELLERGQERYEIFCTVCHGSAGDGRGIIMVGNGGQGYGYVPAPTYHTEALREAPDGYFYDSITNGVRSMPGYAAQITVADRWAIVAYIRALQRSQAAEAEDLPASVLARVEATQNANLQ